MAKESESGKEFLFLIRDFSTHKAHGDRRVSDLNKRMLHLTSDLHSAHSHLDAAKQSRETAHHDLKALQVHLAITSASIQPLHARACNLQDQVSRMSSDLNTLKNKEDAECSTLNSISFREGFKAKMLEMNARIRELQQMAAQKASKQQPSDLPPSEGEFTKSENDMLDSEESLKGLEENLKCINAEMQILEADYEKQLKIHSEVGKELESLRRKVILVESIVKESKLLQELVGEQMKFSLTKHKQTAELEGECASLGEELERKYACPSCGSNNMADVQTTQH